MKSVKMFPGKTHSKANGREMRANGAAKERNVLTDDQHHNKQRQKKNAGGVGNPAITSMDKQVEMTIHEIRNPLTAISLANQSIQEQIQPEQLPDSVFACTAIIRKNIDTIERCLRTYLQQGAVKEWKRCPSMFALQ